ncbi:caiB/baiF CoA-transferase family protein DDB_G0269880 [Aspergillus udagawae]|uniref:CaiB/baiF CoA-transferase family protein DDB_G0269880 n=1 Tax=Aspergillus udagawae TaxID=91492 RepID=A0A8H3NGJ2_9EURO|nr:caiB/baiF CoA-transferase family protein DDB_G0269880 [Aspergillus udagawae]
MTIIHTHPSHGIAAQALNDILGDFNIPLPTDGNGPRIKFTGTIPPPEQTKSEKICLSLVGGIPALACAVTAAQIFQARGGEQQTVEIDLRRGHNYIDPDIGMTPSLNGQEITLDVVAGNPFSRNIFETRDGKWAVLSAVYVDLAYQWTALLECSMTESGVREAVKKLDASDLETLAAKAHMPMAICQSEVAWTNHPQGSHMAKLPIVPVKEWAGANHDTHRPRPAQPGLPRNPSRPLSGLKVIAITHAIAGPATGRTLAEHGASVLQVMFTHGFEHAFVYTYANLGTASTRLNLNRESDRDRLWTLVRGAHVWIDSYREGAIAKFGFSDDEIRKANPGMIISHIRCYGTSGPWAWKPGFDMQGSASSGLMYLMGQGVGDGRPQWPPGMVINDYTTAYFGALAIMGIILRRCRGQSSWSQGWNVSPSLCGTAMGILKFFKTNSLPIADLEASVDSALPPETLEGETPLGYLRTLAPLPHMSATPLRYEHGLLMTMGSARPVFPGHDDGYDVTKLTPWTRRELIAHLGVAVTGKLEKLRALGALERDALKKKCQYSS